MQSKITAEIWEDADFIELSDDEKLCVFWLLTKCDPLGYVETTKGKFKRDLGISFDTIEGACKGLARGFIRTERGVWVKNYIRHQYSSGEALARSNMVKSLRKRVATTPAEISALVLAEYPEIEEKDSLSPKNSKAPTKGLQDPLKGEGEGEGEGEGTDKDKDLGGTASENHKFTPEQLAAMSDEADNNATPPKPPDDCPGPQIAMCFNEMLGHRLQQVMNPTQKRRDMIRAAWKYPVIGQDFENIKKLFAEVKRSKFLMGYAPGSNFKASYDWIFSDEDRIVRIMEGQFRDEKR